ncbi:MFS transporter [Fodinicola feengrottensis]|uniref:MFS transporter n=1 Tax=Fodinicola feengrottensis TaxID=435914 RepID=A0ABN2HV83_9ACTN
MTSRSRWLSLIVLCAGMLMIILDQNIVNVALRSIQQDLGFTPAGLAWVVNAYGIPFGGLLLLSGRLGDLLGRKRIFLSGLALFTAASLLCGLAWTPGLLIAARLVQGIGGALTAAVVLGMIVTLFQEPRERAKAIGVFSFVGSAGASIGILAGGVLTQFANWHWIFFVNLPIGLLIGVAGVRLLDRESGLGLPAGADVAGGALVTGGLMLGGYAISEATADGWASVRVIVLGIVAVALLAGFVLRQARAAAPLLRLRILANPVVWASNLVQALWASALFGFQFLRAIYLQQVLHYGPVETGLAFLPTTIAIGTLSLGFSARLTTRFGAQRVLLAGLALVGVALALMAWGPEGGAYVTDVLPSMVLLGVGAGMTLPSTTTIAMSAATPADSGLVSGLLNTTLQVGGALGLAVLVSLAAARTSGIDPSAQPSAAALVSGYQLAFGIGAGLVLAAVVVTAVVLTRRPAPTATTGSVATAGAAR